MNYCPAISCAKSMKTINPRRFFVGVIVCLLMVAGQSALAGTPVFSSPSSASVNEGVAAGTPVYTAQASETGNPTLTYSLSGTDAAAFTINSTTGVVTINSVPDFETKSSYSFNVKASDSSGGSATQAVTLSVNDLPPVITSPTTANVNEGVAPGTAVYTEGRLHIC
jgi:hypothetical protein